MDHYRSKITHLIYALIYHEEALSICMISSTRYRICWALVNKHPWPKSIPKCYDELHLYNAHTAQTYLVEKIEEGEYEQNKIVKFTNKKLLCNIGVFVRQVTKKDRPINARLYFPDCLTTGFSNATLICLLFATFSMTRVSMRNCNDIAPPPCMQRHALPP